MKAATGLSSTTSRDQTCEEEAPVVREFTRRPGGSNEADISSLDRQALIFADDGRRSEGNEETADEKENPEAGGDPVDPADTTAEEREAGDEEEELSLEDRQRLLAILRKLLLLPKVLASSGDLAPLEKRAGGSSAEAAGTRAPHLERHWNAGEHKARGEATNEEKAEEAGDGKEGEAGTADALSCLVPLSRLGEILVGILGNLFSHSSLFKASLLASSPRKAERLEIPASSASSPLFCRELFECLVDLLLLSEDTRILKETLRAWTAILFNLSRMPHPVLVSLLARAHKEPNEPQGPESSSSSSSSSLSSTSSSSFAASSPLEHAGPRPATSAESDDACAAEAVLSKCLFILRHTLSPDLTAAVAAFLSQLFTFLLSFPFPSALSCSSSSLSCSSSALSSSFSGLLFPSPSAFLRAVRTPAFLALPESSSLSSEAADEASLLVLVLQRCQEFFGGSSRLLPPSRLACLLSQVGSRDAAELDGDEVRSLSAVSRELFQCSLNTHRASTGEQALKEENEENEENEEKEENEENEEDEEEDVEEPENVRGLVDLLLLLDASVVLLEATARETGELSGPEGLSASENANSGALERLLSYSLQVCGKALLSAAQETSLLRVSLLLLLRVASEAPLRRRVEAYVHLMMCSRKGEGVLEKLLLLREEDDLVEDADPLLGILFVAQFAPRHLQKEAKNELLSVAQTHVAAQPAARGVRTPQRGGVGAEERDEVEHEVEGASFQMSDFLDASFLEFLLSVIEDSP
ncbi:hypothetical protein TGMAS_249800 [Toxoplasma gondii MAS]|uniref:Uncharacterized protein n=1 Tax=Toxoplasma gondii MAS TaxID=943118 RepID=A0A086PTM7_TOXGO|nr:hypothetical protein TGMAS_249800 [Toxoplasma gondii MAS]